MTDEMRELREKIQAVLVEADEGVKAATAQMGTHLVTQPKFAGSDGSRAVVHQRYAYLMSQLLGKGDA